MTNVTTIQILIFLNVVAAFAGGICIYRKFRTPAILVFMALHTLLYALKPWLIIEYDLVYPYLTEFVTPASLFTYLCVGLLFITVFLVAMNLFLRAGIARHGASLYKIFDYDSTSCLKLVLVITVFAAITYIANVKKFHSPMYFLGNSTSSFAAMMELAKGGWYIQVLSTALFFPLVVLLSKFLKKGLLVANCSFFIIFSFYWVLCRPSVRTPFLALFLSVAFFYVKKRQLHLGLMKLVTLGVAFFVLIFITNFLRNGGLEGVGAFTMLDFLSSVSHNLNPADNGVALVKHASSGKWADFSYLLIALTPLILIPRAIFPFKPEGEIQNVLTTKLFGNLDLTYFSEGSTLTFTVPALSYVYFGFLSVVLAAVVYAAILSFFIKGECSQKFSTSLICTYFGLKLVASYRTGLEAILTETYVFFLLFTIIYIISRVELYDRSR